MADGNTTDRQNKTKSQIYKPDYDTLLMTTKNVTLWQKGTHVISCNFKEQLHEIAVYAKYNLNMSN